MLWYKAWLETRWRFLIGLGLLTLSACGVVVAYPEVLKLLPMVPELGGEIGRKVRESAELARSYRGYVWSKWFREHLMQMGTLFAVLLGTGGFLSQSPGTLFTLSMPASRSRLFGIRAAAGLAELAALAFIPSLVIPLFSPAIRESYGIGSTLIHSACFFVAGSVFFAFACLLSTIFGDLWRPLLIALFVAIALGLLDPLFQQFSIFRVMSAESYFRGGSLPWIGLLTSAAITATLYYGAAMNLARRDF